MAKKRTGRKARVRFRPNRATRRRSDEWTRQFHAEEDQLQDTDMRESVRPKGELSRKRTVILGADDATLVDENLWLPGTVVTVHGLICFIDDNDGRIWECTIRRVLRTLLIDNRSPVTVGDRVWFSDQSKSSDGQPIGVIERVARRKSLLSRRDTRGRQHAIVANADQLLIVASVAEPRLKPHLIDRYLVAAHKGGLKPLVCFNKMDLATDNAGIDPEDLLIYTQRHGTPDDFDPQDQVQQQAITIGSVLNELRHLGYHCVCTSAETGAGLQELRDLLAEHVTVLAGQSGVGKSTLLNKLQPGLKLKVADVSRISQKGRHTTSHAQLLRLDSGGYVVDTPGIRMFELWNMDPAQLEALFPDFAPHLPHCRFKDCLHLDEQGCAVRKAAENGAITLRRYLSYLKMFTDSARA
ncbi:MAG: ribosome small subunit-dependent GTPase A [Planctomycetota bacterium]